MLFSLARAEPASANAEADPGDVPRLPGIFNIELPQTLRMNNLRFILRPHFGDLLKRDHLSFTSGFRYGVSHKWELNADMVDYFGHGLGDAKFFKKVGISKVTLGTKYRFETFFRPFWSTACGLNYSFPVGRPPDELTDGLTHCMPFMTMSHVFERRPDLTGILSYGFDLVSTTNVFDDLRDTRFGDDSSWFITPGLILHRGNFDYTVETTFSTTAGLGESSKYSVTVRPGIAWTLPPKLKLNARSRWVLGCSLEATHGSEDSDFGANVRLQTEFDFKRLLPWYREAKVGFLSRD